MDDDADSAAEYIAGLEAHIEGLEKCIGVVMASLVHHQPEMSETLIDGFQSFAQSSRKENGHEREIGLFERMAEWLRRERERTARRSDTGAQG